MTAKQRCGHVEWCRTNLITTFADIYDVDSKQKRDLGEIHATGKRHDLLHQTKDMRNRTA